MKENMIRQARLLDEVLQKYFAGYEVPEAHYDSVSICFLNAYSDKDTDKQSAGVAIQRMTLLKGRKPQYGTIVMQ